MKKVKITIGYTVMTLMILVVLLGGGYMIYLQKQAPPQASIFNYVVRGTMNSEGVGEVKIVKLGEIQGSVSVTCSPATGYTDCYAYEYEERYGKAKAVAHVEIMGNSQLQGDHRSGSYWVGDVSIKYRMSGDKFYVFENVGSWDNLWSQAGCGENGCNGKAISKNGDYVVASIGQQYTDCPAFVAYDYDFDEASNGDWSWAWTVGGWGWSQAGNCFDVKSVACYDDTDCQDRYKCDKSGSWESWGCVPIPKGDYWRLDETVNTCTLINLYEDQLTPSDYQKEDECKGELMQTVFRYHEDTNTCEELYGKKKDMGAFDFETKAECKELIQTDYTLLIAISMILVITLIVGAGAYLIHKE